MTNNNMTKKALRDIITAEELVFVSQRVNETFEDIDSYYNKFNVSQVNDFHRAFEKYKELHALEAETAETETETAESAPGETIETADSKTTKERATVDYEAIRVNTINAVKSALKSAPTEVALKDSTDKLVMKATKFTFTATSNDINKKHRFYIKAEGTKTGVRVQYTKDSFNVVSNAVFMGCTETTQAHPFRATKLSMDDMINAVVSAFYDVVKAETAETAEEA